MQPAALLEASGLSKRFGGAAALDNVDLEICAGEVHALLGENGAGKSTLIKILAGVYVRDAGDIRMRGRLVDPAMERLPISFIHQDLGLVDTMTVAENVAVLAGYPRRRGLIAWKEARAAAVMALDRMGGGMDPDLVVGDLGAAEKSIVAIARALAVDCEILVLDEPTAALPEADVARLLEVLRRLKEDGLGIVYVTHRLDEVFRIADRVTVLRDGRRVTTETVAATSPAPWCKPSSVVRSPIFSFPPRPAAAKSSSLWKSWFRATSGRSLSQSPPARLSVSSASGAQGTTSSAERCSGTRASLRARCV